MTRDRSDPPGGTGEPERQADRPGTAKAPRFERPIAAQTDTCSIFDDRGSRYLDFTSGAFCASLGYARPDLVEAMAEAARRLPHVRPSLFESEEAAAYRRELLAAVGPPFAAVLLTSSGSEAVDVALKASWFYQRALGRSKRIRFASIHGHYHGATLGALGVTAIPERREAYEPILTLPVSNTGEGDTAALIAETIPVAGLGVRIPVPGALDRIRERCNESGTLWIADEVLTGFGRTGRLFAWQRLAGRAAPEGAPAERAEDVGRSRQVNQDAGQSDRGAIPDLVVFGKAAGAGYASLAGVILSERVASVIEAVDPPFTHRQTYGESPIAAAVGRVVLRELSSPWMLDAVAALEVCLAEALRPIGSHPLVRDVRGLGALWGIELAPNAETERGATNPSSTRRRFTAGRAEEPPCIAARIAQDSMERGLIVHAATAAAGRESGGVIVLAPPLVATVADVEEASGILVRALDEMVMAKQMP